MGTPPNPTRRRRWGLRRRIGALALAVLLAGLVVFALSRLDLHGIGHALTTAEPGWIALAIGLMMLSLVLRACSWHQTLRAALPDTPISWAPVIRATMIGVMASAVFPGRVGEPTRMLVLARNLEGPTRSLFAVVAGTVFSQTLINLLALGILAVVTFSSVTLPGGDAAGIASVLAVPGAIGAVVLAGPRLLALGRRSRSERVVRWAEFLTRLLNLARQGLRVFARPRFGGTAISLQLLAWVLQWLSCYTVILALGLDANLTAAAAVLLAVNVSAVLPATPSNVGVFQAACLVVLSAFGVGASAAIAYGIILQAVEVITALSLGIPALLAEGLSWEDIRPGRQAEGAESS
jgi:phosphatidylinositol alpha-mannosyltransferase